MDDLQLLEPDGWLYVTEFMREKHRAEQIEFERKRDKIIKESRIVKYTKFVEQSKAIRYGARQII